MSTKASQPLVLHAHNGGGPNPFKVGIALEILELPYTVKLWEFGDASNGVKGSTFTAINPNGRVPALEDPNTGVTVWESQAIINYLIRTYDASTKKLQPYGSEQERATAEAFESLLITTLGPFQGQVNWWRHFAPSPRNEQALTRYVEQTYRAYGIFEGQLGKSGGKSVVSGGVSPVDLHFYSWVVVAPYGEIKLDEYPKVKAWFEGLKEHKAFKDAYVNVKRAEGNTKV